jgi:hypothetical protein
MNQDVLDFPEALAKRLQQQVVLAPEMLVKASVRQAGVFHHGRNRGAIQAFSPHATRCILDNLPMDFRFVFGPVTHD